MTARNTKTTATTKLAAETVARAAKTSKIHTSAAQHNAEVKAKIAAARAEHAAKAKPKAQLKPTVVEELGAQEEEAHTAFAEFQRMFTEFKLPSGKRMLMSVIVNFITIASGVYSGMQVAAMLSLAAVAFTGSAFLAFVAYFVAVALAIYGSIIAGARIGRYIALGEIDHDIKRARSWISDKFTSIKSRMPGSKDEGDQHA